MCSANSTWTALEQCPRESSCPWAKLVEHLARDLGEADLKCRCLPYGPNTPLSVPSQLVSAALPSLQPCGGRLWTESRNTEMIKKIDRNKDGKVQEGEFVQHFNSTLPGDMREFMQARAWTCSPDGQQGRQQGFQSELESGAP